MSKRKTVSQFIQKHFKGIQDEPAVVETCMYTATVRCASNKCALIRKKNFWVGVDITLWTYFLSKTLTAATIMNVLLGYR